MNVDELLRESLQRRAESVEPSFDAWAEISRRVEHRQRRTRTMSMTLAAGLSFAAVALVVVLASVAGPDATEQHVATGGPDPAGRPTTTYAPSAGPAEPGDGTAATTATPSASGQDPNRPGAGPGSPGPSIAAAPFPASPGMTSDGFPTMTIWPETAAELESLQAGVDGGQQPWRNDPEQVAARYLDDRALPTSGAGAPRSIGERSSLRYASGGVGGWVSVGQLGIDGIYFVQGSRSDRIVRLTVTRQGDRLAVDVTATAPGKVVVRTKRPGSEWNAGTTRTVAAEESVRLDVAGPAGTDLIVQVRHEGDDGGVGISDQLLGSVQPSLDYAGLDTGSVLEAKGLGPLSVGMTLDETERFAGIAMVRDGGENACTRLSPAGRPEGVQFIAIAGSDLVDVIVVSAPGVRTGRDIGVGDSVADVRQAYPGIEERLTDGHGRMVHLDDDPVTPGYEMFFEISDGRVAAMWSGHTGVSDIDELCG